MTTLERLLRHDAWTTRQLLTIACTLMDADLDREFDIGHRSLRRTLVHIIANMECWYDLMSGRPQRPGGAGAQNTIAGLTDRLDRVGAELLELGRRVETENRADETFADYLDLPPRQKALGAGLAHIITHSMHHRAQCLHLMRRLGMENLMEGDVFTWENGNRGA
ncbi:MAG TPA: DinB family protein [Tepidisphaeraceae bacterium]|jgi:uncharacterized damage-inducible protein DinB|nr:DinB family protein [Tepidisphaeraceae bacterium]